MAVKAKAEITISRIVDVEKVTTYYLLQSSTAAAPSKPADGSAIGSNWSKTEPSYSSGSTMTLYFVTQTVLSNGTIKYSEVSKSSSYEAAKEAWNKANSAQNTANSANSKVNGLRVGGRNLLRNSQKLGLFKTENSSHATWNNNVLTRIQETYTDLYGIYYDFEELTPGATYTFSVKVKFMSPGNISISAGGDKAASVWTGYGIKTCSTDGRISITIKLNSEETRIRLYISSNQPGTSAQITEAKLEEGNIATDWTPAPEDIESRVTAAETNISNNTKQIEFKASKTEVRQISSDLNAYKDTTTKFIQDTNGWELNWETLIRTDEADIANHTDYITFKNGDILLGDSASTTKMQISKEKVQIKEGADAVATFGSTTRIGKESNRNAVVDQNGFKVYNATEIIAQLGYGNAKNKDGNTEYFPYYTIGIRKADSAVGGYSNADGYNVVASGWCAHVEGNESQSTNYASHAEGYKTVSSNQASHAEGQETTASGFVSHAEGHLTKATEAYSHAEGNSTEASGFASHAEGDSTSASGAYAHAEGCNTYTGDVAAHAEGSGSSANGAYSHAEGSNTTAKGQASHAGGIGTVAKENFQTAIGTYNADSKDALLIVGNGSDANNRKNAFTVLSTGNAKVAGVMEAGNGFMSQNNQAYFGKYTDGSGAAMMHMGPDNNQYVGYGNFISKKGGLILQGGTIQFNVSSPKNWEWFPYYKPGDTYNVNYKGGAFITNSGTNVIFTIPIDKPLINVSAVTITSTNGLMIRQNGKYLYGSSGSAFAKPSSYSAVVYANVIVITAVMGNTTNVTNNDGCGVDAQIRVTFS